MESPYLTPAEAARYTRRKSTKAFNEWARRHRIPPCGFPGGAVLYLRSDLDAILQARREAFLAAHGGLPAPVRLASRRRVRRHATELQVRLAREAELEHPEPHEREGTPLVT